MGYAYVGRGCRGAREQVLALAKKLQAPIVNSLKGANIIEFNHDYRIGGIGHLGTPQGIYVLGKCKCLLTLGSDFPYSAFLPKHGNIIQIDIDPINISKRISIKLGIQAHVVPALEQLTKKVAEKKASRSLATAQNKRVSWNKMN